MEEEIVSYETAKLAKEKGFNEKCQYIYKKETTKSKYMLTFSAIFVRNSELSRYHRPVCAPTQSFLTMWLRKKHQLLITIYSITNENWQFRITKPNDVFEKVPLYEDFLSYESALAYALEECLSKI